jgi:hypothetical protein
MFLQLRIKGYVALDRGFTRRKNIGPNSPQYAGGYNTDCPVSARINAPG